MAFKITMHLRIVVIFLHMSCGPFA